MNEEKNNATLAQTRFLTRIILMCNLATMHGIIGALFIIHFLDHLIGLIFGILNAAYSVYVYYMLFKAFFKTNNLP